MRFGGVEMKRTTKKGCSTEGTARAGASYYFRYLTIIPFTVHDVHRMTSLGKNQRNLTQSTA